MNLVNVETLLADNGFVMLRTNLEEVSLYYKTEADMLYLLMFCSFEDQNQPDAGQLAHMLAKISLDTRFGAGGRSILAVLYTPDMAYARNLIRAGIPAWIIDRNTDCLMIYEDQPSDFAGIRDPLEKLLEENNKPERRQKNSQITPVNTVIVVLNVLIFLIMTVSGGDRSGEMMIRWGAMYTPIMDQPQEYYRIFTSMFLHFDVMHLTGNMIILFALGDNLERALGKIRYLMVYLLSGTGAGIISTVYNILLGRAVVAAGASGAIFGVIGALFCLVVKNRGRLEEITAPRLGMMILYILYSGFTTPGIDNAAHVGGLLTGIAVTVLLHRNTAGKRGKI